MPRLYTALLVTSAAMSALGMIAAGVLFFTTAPWQTPSPTDMQHAIVPILDGPYTYYVSWRHGNDAFSCLAAQDPKTPKKSLTGAVECLGMTPATSYTKEPRYEIEQHWP